MKYKIITSILTFILLFGVASALTIDNVKSDTTYTKDTPILVGDKSVDYNSLWEKYKPIEITNAFGFGDTLFSGALTSHTETCEEDCYSTMEIYTDGSSALIDDIKFYDVNKDMKEVSIRDYNLKYLLKVKDIDMECSAPYIHKNGSLAKDCEFKDNGYIDTWANYYVGDTLPIGTYTLKLNGDKKPSQAIDWIITSQGKELTEWATWGNSTSGDSYVNLTSPANGYSYTNGTLIFNISAFPIGTSIANISIWTNNTGTWKMNNSEVFTASGTPSLKEEYIDGANTAPISLTEWSGEAFQASSDYTLSSIALNISVSCAANITIWNMTADTRMPDKIMLYNNTFNTTTGGWHNITFNGTLPLTSGSYYGIVAQLRGAASCGIVTAEPGAYANGNFLYTDDSGTNWTDPDISSRDMSFEVFATSYIPNLNVSSEFTIPLTFQQILARPEWVWNGYACDTDGDCGWAQDNSTIRVNMPYEVNNNTYNTTTYETERQTFITNVTTNGTIPSTAYLYYNGTQYAGTVTSQGSNTYLLSKSLDVPSGSLGTKNWFWNYIGSDSSSTNLSGLTQTVYQINFTICGAAPATIPYINFTFKNETTAANNVNASIPSSTWTYWLSMASVNKTYTYLNASELDHYGFCFMPGNRTVNVQGTISYESLESTQRQFSFSSALTNTTTTQTLWLLPTQSGIYSRYKVISVNGEVISAVSSIVSRSISGTSYTISSGLTDSAGQIAFFLNPDLSYDYSFSKTGVGSTTFSLTPNSVDTYIITLGTSTQLVNNGTEISRGLNYTIFPLNSTLNNNTNYVFALNVSGYETITLISLNVTNSTGTQVLFISNAGQGYISGIYNTGNDTLFNGRAIIQTATEKIVLDKRWVIFNYFIGDYSIYRQLTLFSNYGFTTVWRIALTIMFIFILVLLLNKGDVSGLVEESKIMVIVLLFWAFSIVGWLDLNLISTLPDDTSQAVITLTQYSSKYTIAIISSVIGSFFVFGRFLNR